MRKPNWSNIWKFKWSFLFHSGVLLGSLFDLLYRDFVPNFLSYTALFATIVLLIGILYHSEEIENVIWTRAEATNRRDPKG